MKLYNDIALNSKLNTHLPNTSCSTGIRKSCSLTHVENSNTRPTTSLHENYGGYIIHANLAFTQQ